MPLPVAALQQHLQCPGAVSHCQVCGGCCTAAHARKGEERILHADPEGYVRWCLNTAECRCGWSKLLCRAGEECRRGLRSASIVLCLWRPMRLRMLQVCRPLLLHEHLAAGQSVHIKWFSILESLCVFSVMPTLCPMQTAFLRTLEAHAQLMSMRQT